MLFACISYDSCNRDENIIRANCIMRKGIYNIKYNNNMCRVTPKSYINL